jgi:hypothetical protein
MSATASPLTLQRLRLASLAAALLGIVLAILALLQGPELFLRAYLAGYAVWLPLAVGSLAFLLTPHLINARLVTLFGRALQAAAWTVPLLALLALPLVLDLAALFPWAREEYLAAHEVVARKEGYLGVTFFLLRAAAIWLVWLGLMLAFAWPRSPFPPPRPRPALAGIGAIVWTLAGSFAAVDWIMSVEPTFYASSFGLLFLTQAGLAAYAFAVLVTVAQTAPPDRDALLRETRLIGLGSVLLTLVLLWGYVAFMQYLVIWSGNTEHRAEWYVARGEGAWLWVILAVMTAKGAIPLAALLSPTVRRSWRAVAILCALILAAHLAEMLWEIVPSFADEGSPSWWQVAGATLAIGGLWAFACLAQLRPITQEGGASLAEAARG